MTDLSSPETLPRTGRAREALFKRLLDLVAMPGTRIAHQDRSMVGDILLDMLLHATNRERMMCAARLAQTRECPRRVLRYLCQCDIEIARPVLEQNESLDAVELNEIAMTGSPEHRLVIARRKTVPASVVDLLGQNGEPHIVRELLGNVGAVFPEQTLDTIVMRSREEESFCALLIERLEIRPSQALSMFWWADGPTRRKILQRQTADRLQVIDTCKDVFELAAEERWQDPVARKALQLIERRQRNRAAAERSPYGSLEGAINAAAIDGMNAQVAQEIGYLSGLKPVTVAKILSDKGGEGLAVLCKATGLKREFLQVLWAALKRPFEISEGVVHPQFVIVADTYEYLTVAKAQTTLRYWNWSLSSAFSTEAMDAANASGTPANEGSPFSASQRTARLVFGR